MQLNAQTSSWAHLPMQCEGSNPCPFGPCASRAGFHIDGAAGAVQAKRESTRSSAVISFAAASRSSPTATTGSGMMCSTLGVHGTGLVGAEVGMVRDETELRGVTRSSATLCAKWQRSANLRLSDHFAIERDRPIHACMRVGRMVTCKCQCCGTSRFCSFQESRRAGKTAEFDSFSPKSRKGQGNQTGIPHGSFEHCGPAGALDRWQPLS